MCILTYLKSAMMLWRGKFDSVKSPLISVVSDLLTRVISVRRTSSDSCVERATFRRSSTIVDIFSEIDAAWSESPDSIASEGESGQHVIVT